MTYVGRGVDAISNVEKLDNITFNGGTTYALTKSSAAFTPVGANNILVSIDGVIQNGNFSVSTTNIVFDFSPTSSNTCDFVLHYGTGVLNVPADGAVSTAKLAADAVTGAKIADDQIDSEHYVDGSIDLAHMSSESVDEDNLKISNAGSNGNFLQKQSGNTGGLTWASASADADNYFASSGLSSKDLGNGLHIKTADTSADVHNDADELVIENSSTGGITILSGTGTEGRINFGDSGDNDIGRINYSHASDYMTFYTNTAIGLKIDSTGAVTKPLQPAFLAGNGADASAGTNLITLPCGTEVYDQNADFNTSTSTFTAPVTGRYLLSANGASYGMMGSTTNQISLITSNRNFLVYETHSDRITSTTAWTGQVTAIVDMDASDTAYVQFGNNDDTSWTVRGTVEKTWFSGCLLA